jgi:hypothetical protein
MNKLVSVACSLRSLFCLFGLLRFITQIALDVQMFDAIFYGMPSPTKHKSAVATRS